MFKILRIVSSVIAAASVAAAIFVFIYLGWGWGLVCVAGACLFFGATLLFRNLQRKEEQRLNPPEEKGDFITGRVKKDEDK